MPIEYYGKRMHLGNVLMRSQNVSSSIIDLIGLSCSEANGFATAVLRMPYPARVILLSVDSSPGDTSSLVRYYSKLEEIIRGNLEKNGLRVITLLAPAIIEELAPYASSRKKIFGSYPETSMPWCTGIEVVSRIANWNTDEPADVIRVPHAFTATVEQALGRLTGTDPKRFAYRHLSPDILADVYRQRGMSERDSQVADQLPYYQYYVGHKS